MSDPTGLHRRRGERRVATPPCVRGRAGGAVMHDATASRARGRVLVALIAALLAACTDDARGPTATAPVATMPAFVTREAESPAMTTKRLPNGQVAEYVLYSVPDHLLEFLQIDAPAPRTFDYQPVVFEPGTAVLHPYNRDTIVPVAAILVAYPRVRVTLVGYGDFGQASGADALGLARAQALVDALVARGVAADRLQARSGGVAEQPYGHRHANGDMARIVELIVTAK